MFENTEMSVECTVRTKVANKTSACGQKNCWIVMDIWKGSTDLSIIPIFRQTDVFSHVCMECNYPTEILQHFGKLACTHLNWFLLNRGVRF